MTKLIQLNLDKDDAAIISYLLGAGMAYSSEEDDICSATLGTISTLPGFFDRAQALSKKIMMLSKATWTEKERAIDVAIAFKEALGVVNLVADVVDGKLCANRGSHCTCSDDTCYYCGKSKLLNPL